MSDSVKALTSSLLLCFVNSCSLDNTDIDQTLTITSEYVVEMDSKYTISKYTFTDSDESFYGDNDCITEYTYYKDSIILISDGRSVTQRGDYTKVKYYLNSKGLADSSLTEVDPGNLPKSSIRHYFVYNDSEYLTTDSTSTSVITYHYSDGNIMKSVIKFLNSTSTTTVYTYNNQENRFSFNGSFLGKTNKNLILSVIISYYNGEIQNLTFGYELYPEGLVKEATRTTFSGSSKIIDIIKYDYLISN